MRLNIRIVRRDRRNISHSFLDELGLLWIAFRLCSFLRVGGRGYRGSRLFDILDVFDQNDQCIVPLL